jgi:uncharacterized protein YerC
MAKRSLKMTKEDIEKLFYKLCLVITKTNKIEDSAKLLKDLLSIGEAEMIAKRIKIAELLLDEITYAKISKSLKVSYSTINRVSEWLLISGDGYREAVKKTKGKELKKNSDVDLYDPENWNSLKKRFPMYYWPEILLENIVATSNKRQKQKINSVLRQMDKMKNKSELYGKLKRIINKHKKR